MTRSVGEIDNICRKSSYKIDKSHGATYMGKTVNFNALQLWNHQLIRDHQAEKTCQKLVQPDYHCLDESCWDAEVAGRVYQCDPSLQG